MNDDPKHHDHGGRLCTDADDDGCCDVCHVSLVDCTSCNGRGYHHAGCSEDNPVHDDEDEEGGYL